MNDQPAPPGEDAVPAPEHKPSPERHELRRVLGRCAPALTHSRGRGAHGLRTLVFGRLHGAAPLTPADERLLANVIESLTYAVDDAQGFSGRLRTFRPLNPSPPRFLEPSVTDQPTSSAALTPADLAVQYTQIDVLQCGPGVFIPTEQLAGHSLPDVVVVAGPDLWSGKMRIVENVSTRALNTWAQGALIQDAFPNMPLPDRSFLASGGYLEPPTYEDEAE